MSKSNVELLCDEGRSQLSNRDYRAAVKVFSQAIEIDPDCCEAHEGLATCAFLEGDYHEAIKHYTQLNLLKPMESRFLTNLGAIHNRIGEYLKACDYLRKAIQRNKRCAESFYNLGIAQRKLKQNSMAVSAYKEAIKIDPKMAEAHQNLGNVYTDMGNLQMAITCFKQALEIRPDFEKARIGLEKAEEQLTQLKSKNNQFGRLAAMQSTVSTVAPITVRELRDDERFEDRTFVKHAADEIEHIARACVDHLHSKVIPAVLEVERAMAHGVDDIFLLDHASTDFRTATSLWYELRKTLRNRMEELHRHEQALAAGAESR